MDIGVVQMCTSFNVAHSIAVWYFALQMKFSSLKNVTQPSSCTGSFQIKTALQYFDLRRVLQNNKLIFFVLL